MRRVWSWIGVFTKIGNNPVCLNPCFPGISYKEIKNSKLIDRGKGRYDFFPNFLSEKFVEFYGK